MLYNSILKTICSDCSIVARELTEALIYVYPEHAGGALSL